MQTKLPESLLQTFEGQEAEAILRACVHCGFCLATCPTYQLTGNELDSPRGRIYLIKNALEGSPVTRITQHHLDRCLTCRSCERACPSLVQYGRLLEIGRAYVHERFTRPFPERAARNLLRLGLLNRSLFERLIKLARLVRPCLPLWLKRTVAHRSASQPVFKQNRVRKMLILEGCVQPGLASGINEAARRVLDRMNLSLVSAKNSGCCGSLSLHLDAREEAFNYMRQNIDAWWPHIESGIEAIIMTASGCGVTVREYGKHLAHDPAYAERARRVSELTRDISEVILAEGAVLLSTYPVLLGRHVAFHAPCTLQHGQSLRGVVEEVLVTAGAILTDVPEGHMCCGSAGAYSFFEPEMSKQLRRLRLEALQSGAPEEIVTANIGCMMHLAAKAKVPVRHWIELLDDGFATLEKNVPYAMPQL